MNNNGSFLTGFMLGGLIGASVALIFAPQRGKDARMSLGNREVGLNQSMKRPVSNNQAVDGVKTTATISYEPPRIILDEETSASAPPTT